MKRTRAAVLIALASFIMPISACGADSVENGGPAASAESSAASSKAQVRLFSGLFAGYSLDAAPFENAAAMARASEAVVTGKIVRVFPGRTLYTGDPDQSSTVVFEIAIEKAFAGETNSDGRAYVEIRSGGVSAEDFDKYAPRDLTVLLYLVDAPSDGTTYGKVIPQSDEAARIEARLLKPVAAEGFVIETGDSSVVQPMEGEIIEGMSLEEFLPLDFRDPSSAQVGAEPTG